MAPRFRSSIRLLTISPDPAASFPSACLLAAEVEQSYSLKSYRRGNFEFGSVFYRVAGPLGLIQRQGKVPLPQSASRSSPISREKAPGICSSRWPERAKRVNGAPPAGEKGQNSNRCANISTTTIFGASIGKPRPSGAS